MKDSEFTCLGQKPGSSLSIVLKNEGIMGGPYIAEFNFDYGGASFHIVLDQCLVRTVSIASDSPVALDTIWMFYTRLERLLMVFDGRFYTIDSVTFSSEALSEYECKSYAEECVRRRIACYKTDPIYCYIDHHFLDFNTVLSADILAKWIALDDELDIIHQAALYYIADTGVTHDVKCANIIECLEPMAEIIGLYDNFFPSLNPQDRNVTLKMCIDAVISKYGRDIFSQEYQQNKEQFLQTLVNTRNRMMHIKRNQPVDKFLSGEESILYLVKLYHLYRVVLISLLGIDYDVYSDKVIKSVGQWDGWNGILTNFLNSPPMS